VPDDVLDLDDRVVDQNTDDQRQRQQRESERYEPESPLSFSLSGP